MRKILISVVALFLISACATEGSEMTKDPNAVTAENLQHHNYVLFEIDGKKYLTKKNAMSPNIAFGEKMNISGQMCNNYFGQGELKDGTLTVKGVGMTRKFCADKRLNQLDQKIGQLLEDGAKITLADDGRNLTLSNGKTTLKFWLKDYM